MLKNKRSGIYAIINKVNNKIYIGQSSSITERWKVHKYLLKNNKHYNKHLQSAYNIDGLSNFQFLILELCGQEKMDERESYWIAFFKATLTSHGYNKDSGGSLNKTISEEAKKKISISAKKRGISKEVQEKAWETNRNRKTKDHPMFGRRHSSETRKKLSDSHLGISNGPHSEETKRKISLAHKGKKKGPMSDDRRKLQSITNGRRIPITYEMKTEVVNGLSRNSFLKKYGSYGPWDRIRKAIKGGTLDELI